VQRFLHAQRVAMFLLTAAIVVALGIGFWPVTANVYGNPSYSCGSGFLHSSHRWNIDTQTSSDSRIATSTATGTPSAMCPNKVANRRDLALLVVAFGLALGIVAQILLERPRERSYRQTMFANRRVGTTKVRAPVRPRPRQPDESSVQ